MQAPSLAAIPARLAHLYNVYPLVIEGNHLDVGVPPVHGQHVVDVLAAATDLLVEPRVVPAHLLRLAVERDYLGSGQASVIEAPAGLSTLVVDSEVRQVKPLAPDLRKGELGAEPWLRSVLAEALTRHQRLIELTRTDSSARLTVGGEEVPLPPVRPVPADLEPFVLRLAGSALRPGGGKVTGRFLLDVKGRRLVVTAILSTEGPKSTLRMSVADRRFGSDDSHRAASADHEAPHSAIDDVFADVPEMRDAIDSFASDGRGGLLLTCGPSGGGARRVLELLAARLAAALERPARVTDLPASVVGSAFEVLPAATDTETVRGIHRAVESDAGLIVVDELAGSRSVERALLAAGKRPVLAGLPSTDSAATLAWLARHGFTGALKTGLLRAMLAVVSVEPRCRCAKPARLSRSLLDAWDLETIPKKVVENAGCAECLEAPTRRRVPVLHWTKVAGRSVAELSVEDERQARKRSRAAGEPTLLDLALQRCASGEHEIGAAATLLAAIGEPS
jgi:hypothetical protein